MQQDMLYSQPTELPQVAYQSLSQVRKVDTKVPLPTSSAELVGLCLSTHSWPPMWPAEPLPEAPRPPVAPLLGPGRPLPPEVLAPDQQKAGCRTDAGMSAAACQVLQSATKLMARGSDLMRIAALQITASPISQ